MAIANGVNGQLGWAVEDPYGTAETPTRFLEFLSESLQRDDGRIESAGLRAGGGRILRSHQWAPSKIDPSGSIEMELQTKGLGQILHHVFGAVATSQPDDQENPDVYEHLFTPGELGDKSLTLEVGWDDIAGDPFAKTITGAQFTGATFSCRVDEFGQISLDVVGHDLLTAAAHATAVYPEDLAYFTWVGAALSLADDGDFDSEEFSLQIANNPDTDRFFLGRRRRKIAIEQNYREITGSLNADWENWTVYDRVASGEEVELTLFFDGPPIDDDFDHALELTMHVRSDGDTPQLGGRDRIKQPINFKVIDDGDGGISALYRTTDSTP